MTPKINKKTLLAQFNDELKATIIKYSKIDNDEPTKGIDHIVEIIGDTAEIIKNNDIEFAKLSKLLKLSKLKTTELEEISKFLNSIKDAPNLTPLFDKVKGNCKEIINIFVEDKKAKKLSSPYNVYRKIMRAFGHPQESKLSPENNEKVRNEFKEIISHFSAISKETHEPRNASEVAPKAEQAQSIPVITNPITTDHAKPTTRQEARKEQLEAIGKTAKDLKTLPGEFAKGVEAGRKKLAESPNNPNNRKTGR